MMIRSHIVIEIHSEIHAGLQVNPSSSSSSLRQDEPASSPQQGEAPAIPDRHEPVFRLIHTTYDRMHNRRRCLENEVF